MKNILETDSFPATGGTGLRVEKAAVGSGGFVDCRLEGEGPERFGRLFAVGNGGESKPGHAACERAVRSLMEGFYEGSFTDRVPDRLRQAYGATSSLLYRIGRENAQKSGAKIMCSLTGMLLVQGKFYIMHVGNTKVFLLRSGKLIQLTKDQTVVGKMARLGLISPQEARVHPNRHVLLHYLGELPVIPADFYSGNLTPGDFFFLATPSLAEQAGENELRRFFQSSRGEDGCLHRLLAGLKQGAEEGRGAAITVDTLPSAEKEAGI